MTWAKRYALRNVTFTVSRDASVYGSGTYGGSTYGQEATNPLSNVEYVLAADPGEWPSGDGWVYRVGDEGVPFKAIALGLDGRMDLTPVDAATLVIERASSGPRVVKAFELVVDDTNDLLVYEFVEGDLSHQGMYRAAVQLVFASGRCLTLTPDDSTAFLVRGAG